MDNESYHNISLVTGQHQSGLRNVQSNISPWIRDEAHNNKKQENGGSELKTQTSKTKRHEDSIVFYWSRIGLFGPG